MADGAQAQEEVRVGGIEVVLGALDLTPSTVGLGAECESNCSAAGNLGDGFDDEQDNDIVNVGLKYGFGAANVSVGYEFNKFGESDFDDAHIFVVSGDYGIRPGVTLLADVSYNTEDLEARDDDVIEQDNTIGGVLSIRLDY